MFIIPLTKASRTNIIWVIIATAGLRMFVECWQMYYAGIEYFLDITNYLEWFLYIFAIMFVIDIEDSTGPVSPASKRTVSLFYSFFITTRSNVKFN